MAINSPQVRAFIYAAVQLSNGKERLSVFSLQTLPHREPCLGRHGLDGPDTRQARLTPVLRLGYPPAGDVRNTPIPVVPRAAFAEVTGLSCRGTPRFFAAGRRIPRTGSGRSVAAPPNALRPWRDCVRRGTPR